MILHVRGDTYIPCKHTLQANHYLGTKDIVS